ncbi:MAG: signal peptidase II [Sulfitobacter sp.]
MRLVFWAGFAAFVTDQLTKYLVVHTMQLWRVREIDVLPPLLNFRYGENRGINFGLFSDGAAFGRWLLIALALVICVGIYLWIRRTPLTRGGNLSAGFLIGGALANVVDRLVYGYVLDFLNMSCCGIDNPFVFNFADIFVFAGALGLVVFTGNDRTEPKKGQ